MVLLPHIILLSCQDPCHKVLWTIKTLRCKKSLDEKMKPSRATKDRDAASGSGIARLQIPGGCKNILGNYCSILQSSHTLPLGIHFRMPSGRAAGQIGCLIWSNINSSCEKRTKYLAYLNKHTYCWNFPNTAFFSAKHLLSLSSYYMIKKTSALVRLIWYFAFWEPFHISLLSSWWLSMVSIIRQDGCQINWVFFSFYTIVLFPKVQTER